MSNAVFPLLQRISTNVSMAPEFSTIVQQAASRRELRTSLAAYPTWTIGLTFQLLRQFGSFDELRTVAGFFLARRGSFDSFLFLNPSDNAVVDEHFGIADGAKTQFQLTRSFGGFAEPVENPNQVTSIKVGGVPQVSGFTIGPTGIVTFSSAPASGAITWSGTFYYRCRFVDDTAEFNQFFKDLYELKKIELLGAPGNKVGA